MQHEQYNIPYGRKGGGKAGGEDFRSPIESPNTLQSVATAKIIDLICEGPSQGFVDGLKSVFHNDTPVQGPDGVGGSPTYNYEGIQISVRIGTPDQTPLPGFDSVGNEFIIGLEALLPAAPASPTHVVHTVNNPLVDRVVPKLRLLGLSELDTTTGDLKPSTVTIAWDIASFNPVTASQNAYVEILQDTLNGKTVSPYEQGYSLELPKSATDSAPYNIRLRRITQDSESSNIQNRTFFGTISELIDEKLSYPDSFTVGTIADTSQYGTRVPKRTYEMNGLIGVVPSNYDPVKREYTGIWDGTFNKAFTNNNVWCLYNLLIQNRFGLGEVFSPERINKGVWYSFAQRCDERVDDGNPKRIGTVETVAGGTSEMHLAGHGFVVGDYFTISQSGNTLVDVAHKITAVPDVNRVEFQTTGLPTGKFENVQIGTAECRFSMAHLLNIQEDVYSVLHSLASSFHGLLFWAKGQIELVQDAPRDSDTILTPSNVIGGAFNYSSTSIRNRTNVVEVVWLNPETGYLPAVEYVEDRASIERFGIKRKRIVAVGCTSRGQARRHGTWVIETAKSETKSVSYRASFDQSFVRPGGIASIQDPYLSGVEYSGRVKSASDASNVVLDRAVDLTAAESRTLYVAFPDETSPAGIRVESAVITTTGSTTDTLVLSAPLTAVPTANLVWAISATSVEPQKYRILSVKETDEPHIFEFSGVYHDPNKYARIDSNADSPSPVVSNLPSGTLASSTDLSISEAIYLDGPAKRSKAVFSWKPPTEDGRVTLHEVQFRSAALTSNAWLPFDGASGVTQGITAEVQTTVPELIEFRIRSRDNFGRFGPFVSTAYVLDALQLTPANVTGFQVLLQTEQIKLSWNKNPGLQTTGYELRFSPLTAGATWAGMQTIMENISAETLSALQPADSGTYGIKAVNDLTSTRIYSKSAAFVILETVGDVGLNQILTFDEHPSWAGTKSGVEVVGGKLQLASSGTMADWVPLSVAAPLSLGASGFASSGTYTFSNTVDLGAVFDVRMTSIIQSDGLNLNSTMSSWVPLSSAINIAGFADDEVTVDLQVRTTNDDPGGSPVWAAWRSVVGAEFRCRAMEFRLLLLTTRSSVTPRVSIVTITIDMYDRIISGEDITVPIGGTTISFTPNFKSTRPAIAVVAADLSSGDRIAITNIDETGYDIEVFDSVGASKSAKIDYIARGYGALIV